MKVVFSIKMKLSIYLCEFGDKSSELCIANLIEV